MRAVSQSRRESVRSASRHHRRRASESSAPVPIPVPYVDPGPVARASVPSSSSPPSPMVIIAGDRPHSPVTVVVHPGEHDWRPPSPQIVAVPGPQHSLGKPPLSITNVELCVYHRYALQTMRHHQKSCPCHLSVRLVRLARWCVRRRGLVRKALGITVGVPLSRPQPDIHRTM